jgi:hypothetical protein
MFCIRYDKHTEITEAAGLETCGGNVSGAERSRSNSFWRSVEYQGGRPVSISYITIPMFHQSTEVPCPCQEEKATMTFYEVQVQAGNTVDLQVYSRPQARGTQVCHRLSERPQRHR